MASETTGKTWDENSTHEVKEKAISPLNHEGEGSTGRDENENSDNGSENEYEDNSLDSRSDGSKCSTPCSSPTDEDIQAEKSPDDKDGKCMHICHKFKIYFGLCHVFRFLSILELLSQLLEYNGTLSKEVAILKRKYKALEMELTSGMKKMKEVSQKLEQLQETMIQQRTSENLAPLTTQIPPPQVPNRDVFSSHSTGTHACLSHPMMNQMYPPSGRIVIQSPMVMQSPMMPTLQQQPIIMTPMYGNPFF